MTDLIESTIGWGWFFIFMVTSPFWLVLVGFFVSEWRAKRRIRRNLHTLSVAEMENHIEWQMRPPHDFNPKRRSPRPPPR